MRTNLSKCKIPAGVVSFCEGKVREGGKGGEREGNLISKKGINKKGKEIAGKINTRSVLK